MTTAKTATKSKSKTAAPRPATPKDAIALLKADHEAVSQLFADYDRTRSASDKRALVAEICNALSVHMQIEEEIFYPAVKAALKNKLLVPEATVEPDGETYDAKVKVLSEYVKHHVMEEHNEMFPKVKASSVDMVELGASMAARKHDLLILAA
jgi:iron-sulfur cluster repair protein YtfE (RIC family)